MVDCTSRALLIYLLLNYQLICLSGNLQKNMNEKEQHVSVSVVTTGGSWPKEGFASVPSHQKVRQELEKAGRELKITDVSKWFARVNGDEIDSEKSYLDLGLSGTVIIDFGPREGGGGQINE